jgi:hypothetical protein
LQNLPHVFYRDPPLEHALYGVDTEDDRLVCHIWDYSILRSEMVTGRKSHPDEANLFANFFQE